MWMDEAHTASARYSEWSFGKMARAQVPSSTDQPVLTVEVT